MKKHSLIWIVVAGFLLSALAFAHGGMDHVMGTVTEVTGHSLSVKTRDGSTKTVEFDGETKFVKGTAAATVKDVLVGTRVIIHAHKLNTTLHAAEVNIGTGAAPTRH